MPCSVPFGLQCHLKASPGKADRPRDEGKRKNKSSRQNPRSAEWQAGPTGPGYPCPGSRGTRALHRQPCPGFDPHPRGVASETPERMARGAAARPRRTAGLSAARKAEEKQGPRRSGASSVIEGEERKRTRAVQHSRTKLNVAVSPRVVAAASGEHGRRDPSVTRL